MKPLLLVGPALWVLGTAAFAQSPLPANQTYCLQVNDATGPHPLLCRFTTMQQCAASKTSPSDHCLLNPELAFRRR
jgi:hypothetical protein